MLGALDTPHPWRSLEHANRRSLCCQEQFHYERGRCHGPTLAPLITHAGRRFCVPELVLAWGLGEDHQIVRVAVTRTGRAGLEARVGRYGFCTDGGLTGGELGIPTIGEAEAHTVDEWFSLADVEAAAAVDTHLVETLLAVDVSAAA